MDVPRGDFVLCRRSGVGSFRLVPMKRDVYTIRVLQTILKHAHQLVSYGQPLVSNHAFLATSKEVITTFQRGERVMFIDVLKNLLLVTLSYLSRPEGKIGSYKTVFVEIANHCIRLLWLHRRVFEDLPLSENDAIISNLHATLRTQGLVGLVAIPPRFIRPTGEIKNTASRSQTKPAEHETLKRKSEGDKNSMCPICLDVIKDEKDEKGTTTWPNCSHRFHFRCILNWLPKKQNCPICRSGIIPEQRKKQSRI